MEPDSFLISDNNHEYIPHAFLALCDSYTEVITRFDNHQVPYSRTSHDIS